MTPNARDSDYDDEVDVVVVGAGPVGSTTALTLARGGLTTLVLERKPTPNPESRASTFHPPTLEMLDRLGLARDLIERGLVADVYQFRDSESGPIANLDYGVLADDTPFPFRLQIEQSHLTASALAAVEAEDTATLWLSSHATSVEDAADGMVVSVDTPTGIRRVRARSVIAADGAHSRVRLGAGVAFEGRTYPERYLVLSTDLPLHEMLDGLATVNYVAGGTGWFVLLRNPSGWRVLFPVAPEGDDDALVAPAAIDARMRLIVGEREDYAVSHVTLYSVHRKVAETFRVGELYLVGDAAHVNNPLGGMGMNSGIHDGVLLADALVARERAAATDADLDEWARRRRSVALDYVGKETELNWNALRAADDDERARQRDGWRLLAADPERRRSYLRRSSMIESLV